MLNRKGRARGINPRALITGREDTFRRYARVTRLSGHSSRGSALSRSVRRMSSALSSFKLSAA